MKKIYVILTLVSLVVVSCGPKPSKSLDSIVKETDDYKSKVDTNSNLEKEIIEGALTDTDGFKDIGSFKYTVYIDSQNKPVKIRNVEVTDQTISETYYFKDGNLVLIEADLGRGREKMYVRNRKIISESKTSPATQTVLLDKAKRFQKAYQKAH